MRFHALVTGVCVCLMLLLAGCVNLGPDYRHPEVVTEPEWLDIGDPKVSSGPVDEVQWWSTTFQDPDLDRLIKIAFEQNLTLRSAGLRVLQSQQQLAIAIGNQFPQQQQVNGSASRLKESGTTFENYTVGFNVGWEVDFWGRFRRQVETASAELDASVADYDGAILSLVSQVAQNYILIRTYQERIEASQQNIRLQKESLRIARVKFEAGAVSVLDVDQAESLLYNTMATISSLETSLQQFKNALAILLGKPPHDLNYLLTKEQVIPTAPATLALGMPQNLVRRRPDIRAAERQLAAQSAQIGFAVTDLYPHLSIGGSIGTSAFSTADLFENDTETWSLFGLFEWDVLNYGRLKSNVRLQDARFQQLLVDYQNALLQAQGEVENAITAYLKAHDQLDSYRLAASASQRSVEIATIQYQEGTVDFNTLITTLASNVQQQDLLSASQGTVATNLVQVYKSLGGGWDIRQGEDPVELLPEAMKDEMRNRTDAWNGVLK
ncbi:MAG: efflux transporter outer membrane subunit [Desulfuromonadales bacterium]